MHAKSEIFFQVLIDSSSLTFLCSALQSGILSVIVEAFIDGLIDDAILVPVSVNYEKLVDGNFVNEQMGTPKKKESFGMAMSSIWKILKSKYGQMRIDFNEPFSLKELVRSFNERQESIPRPIPSARKLLTGPSNRSMYGIEVIDKHRALVDNIARHVVFDCSFATSVMSTNAVSYLLLNKYRNGVTHTELSKTLTKLREQVGTDRDFGFEEEASEVVVDRAVELLGTDLIQRTKLPNDEIFIAPVLKVPNVIETAYYSNTLVPYFALDSVVVSSVATFSKSNPPTMNEVIDHAMLYCDILRYEFIFYKPCQDFTDQIEKSVSRLCKLGVLTRTENDDSVSLNYDSSQTLLSTLAPFSLTYLSVAECLVKLLEEGQMTEGQYVKLCLAHIQEKVKNGNISFGECISTDSVKNCLKLIEKWSVVEVNLNLGVRKLSLSTFYNTTESLQQVAEKIEKFVILK